MYVVKYSSILWKKLNVAIHPIFLASFPAQLIDHILSVSTGLKANIATHK